MDIANLSKATLIQTATGVTPPAEGKEGPGKAAQLALQILRNPQATCWSKNFRKEPWEVSLSKEGILTFSGSILENYHNNSTCTLLKTIQVAQPKAMEVVDVRGCNDSLPLEDFSHIKAIVGNAQMLYISDANLIPQEILEADDFVKNDCGFWVKDLQEAANGEVTGPIWREILGGSLWENDLEYSRIEDLWLLTMRCLISEKVDPNWLDESDPEKTVLLASMLEALGKPELLRDGHLLTSAFERYQDSFSMGQLVAWHSWASNLGWGKGQEMVLQAVIDRFLITCRTPRDLAKDLRLEGKKLGLVLQPMKDRLVEYRWPVDAAVLKKLRECFPDITTVHLHVDNVMDFELETYDEAIKVLDQWPQLTTIQAWDTQHGHGTYFRTTRNDGSCTFSR